MKGRRITFAAVLAVLAVGFLPHRTAAAGAGAQARIYGKVLGFDEKPIAGANVELKNSHFTTVASAVSGPDGGYSLSAPEGDYMALTAVKDYMTKSLEYWAWSVPARGELRIDPHFDRLEVYAMNAWRPQGAYPSYQIYFRPMSLIRAGRKIAEAGGMEAFGKLKLQDIAPDLAPGDITVTIDGEKVDVLKMNKVLEASGPDGAMYGYVIQTGLPKAQASGDYRLITITIADRETGEKGQGCLFLKRSGLL